MKTLFAVVSCWQLDFKVKTLSNDRLETIRKTWLNNVDPNATVKVFYGYGATRKLLPDEVFLPVEDDYYSLPHKVKAICRYAAKRGFDALAKIDDDTFLNREIISRIMSATPDYTGSVFPDGAYACGGCYRLSRRSIDIIASADVTYKPFDIKTGTPAEDSKEDRWVGSVLKKHGIAVEPDMLYSGFTNDPTMIRERFEKSVLRATQQAAAHGGTVTDKTKQSFAFLAPMLHFQCSPEEMLSLYAQDVTT